MILLTGATGTVGRHLVLEFKTSGVPFRVLTRDPARAHALLGPAEFSIGDLSRPETFPAALHGVESAFILSPLDPALAAWEAGFARAAAKAGVKRLVKLSALGADPRSKRAVARWHGEAEEEVRRVGLPCVLLRPAAFYQNILNNADSVRRGTLAAPMGSARLAMVDARDVAAAAAAALTTRALDGAAPVLTGPAPLAYAEIAAALARLLGRPVSYSDVAPGDARRGMLSAGMPAWMTEAILELAEEFRSGGADLSTDDVRRATGRAPISIERFLDDHLRAFA
ncbi:MAG: NAD(P)H-binding protein [Elusimicrobia bacterium]|nr:NAD(P)H-binding protein [Elusimicrobiota bacterium]